MAQNLPSSHRELGKRTEIRASGTRNLIEVSTANNPGETKKHTAAESRQERADGSVRK